MPDCMKPILFSTPMVQAILEDRKTMTRRVVKPQADSLDSVYCGNGPKGFGAYFHDENYPEEGSMFIPARYIPGDILWVRETWGSYGYDFPESNASYFLYRADYPEGAKGYWYEPEEINWCDFPRWRPSIHMPHEAARLFLRVTDVRAERLQEITEADAQAEGVEPVYGNDFASEKRHYPAFARLWEKLNTKRGYGWDTNPWVWVYTFERLERPREG